MNPPTQIYVLTWYPDGSGEPSVAFFDGSDGIEAATFAADQAHEGKRVKVGPVKEHDA